MTDEKKLEKSIMAPTAKLSPLVNLFSSLTLWRVSFLILMTPILVVLFSQNRESKVNWSKDYSELRQDYQSLYGAYEDQVENISRLWQSNVELREENKRLNEEFFFSHFSNNENEVCYQPPENMLLWPPAMDKKFCLDVDYFLVIGRKYGGEAAWNVAERFAVYNACQVTRSRRFMRTFSRPQTLNR